jgi:hypothetical protein
MNYPGTDISDANASSSMLSRFPNDRILGEPKLERGMMTWVWIVVPLQYYVFTRMPGGLRANEWFSIALTVMVCILFVLLLSTLIAVLPFGQTGMSYKSRVQAWSLALVTNWAAAVSLLALSYFLSARFKLAKHDLLHGLICEKYEVFQCANYPSFFSPETYSIYLCYSILAVLVVLVAVLIGTRGANHAYVSVPAPRTIFVPLLTAAILTVLYSSAKLI